MGRRRPRHYASTTDARPQLPRELDWDQFRRHEKILAVKVYLPRPVARMARREVYTYPYPRQLQKRRHVIRMSLLGSLGSSRAEMVPVKVRIRVPRYLPLVRGSYVSLGRGRLNIHSYHQLRRLYELEKNRRRYSEGKGNRRKARYGQLDSPGSTRFGSVAEAQRRGLSIDRIADHALVARAILGKAISQGW